MAEAAGREEEVKEKGEETEASKSQQQSSQGPGKEESDEELECAVCLQKCVHPVRLPCTHIFCFLCVKGVANQSKRCAMCRQEIPADFLDHPTLLSSIEAEKEEVMPGGYQWFYEGRNGWWQYDERTSHELEAAYGSGQRACEVLVAGFLYIIDFDRMVQLRRNDPSRRRRIKRDLSSIPKKGVAGIKLPSQLEEELSALHNAAHAIHIPHHQDGGRELGIEEIVDSINPAASNNSNSRSNNGSNNNNGNNNNNNDLCPRTPTAPSNTPQTPHTPSAASSSSGSPDASESIHLHNLATAADSHHHHHYHHHLPPHYHQHNQLHIPHQLPSTLTLAGDHGVGTTSVPSSQYPRLPPQPLLPPSSSVSFHTHQGSSTTASTNTTNNNNSSGTVGIRQSSPSTSSSFSAASVTNVTTTTTTTTTTSATTTNATRVGIETDIESDINEASYQMNSLSLLPDAPEFYPLEAPEETEQYHLTLSSEDE